MKSLLILSMLIASLSLGSTIFAQEQTATKPETKATQKQEKKSRKDIYDESADVHKVINDALAKAKKENRRVLIQWGANWCGWCHRFEEIFGQDTKFNELMANDYVFVRVDLGE